MDKELIAIIIDLMESQKQFSLMSDQFNKVTHICHDHGSKKDCDAQEVYYEGVSELKKRIDNFPLYQIYTQKKAALNNLLR